jgi:Divergent InlB B-repeat domain/FG-GAP-like repeat
MRKLLIMLLCLSNWACTKEILTHKLSTDASPLNGGSVTPPSNSFEHGQQVSLTATPNGEYVFKNWQGSLSGTTNPTSLLMDADKQVTGVFEKRQYPLTLTIEGNGTVKEEVIAVASQAQYPSGTTVRLTAQPNEGFLFKDWTGDIKSINNPLDIKIEKPLSIIAKFDPRPPVVPIEFQSFSQVNRKTSYFVSLESSYKSYENFNKFRQFMPSAMNVKEPEHLSSAYSFLDFDLDGDSDFIFASTSYTQDRKSVYVIENKGNNTWSLYKKLPGFIWPRKGQVIDVDNNGYLDFIIADQGYDYPPFPGAEIGIVYFFKDRVEVKYIPNSTAYNHTISAADVDNDGDIDLVTVDHVYRNSNGDFVREDNLTAQQQNGYYHLELMDLNQDGNVDLIAGNAENFVNKNGVRNYTRVFWNMGDGKFRYNNATELPIAGGDDTYGMVDDFDFLDFNNDGKLDIIINRGAGIPNAVGYYVQFLQNNGDRTFKEVTQDRIDNYKFLTNDQSSFVWFVWIRLLDMNNDGKLDMIVREGNTPGTVPEIEKEWYWINDGANKFKLKK